MIMIMITFESYLLLVLLMCLVSRETTRSFSPASCNEQRRIQQQHDGPIIRTSSFTFALSSTNPDIANLLYAEQEKAIVSRGEFEAILMGDAVGGPLECNVVKGSGGGGGFGSGGGGGSKKSLLKAQAKAHTRVLQDHGVVRIDNVLSPELADTLREKVYAEREEAERLVADGTVSPKSKFADVLLTHQRRDMPLPLIGPYAWAAKALQAILVDSAVGATLDLCLGTPQAILREWSCLMSDPGSQRQVAHPDTPWQAEPVLYTCFVALQDISEDMGPTTWLPGTHTDAMHQRFFDDESPGGSKDMLLQSQPSVLGTLPKGSCAIFDSRLLHCGGANMSEMSRALLYCSFQNPKVLQVGNPGSIQSQLIGKWTLQSMTKELQLFAKGKPNQLVQEEEEADRS